VNRYFSSIQAKLDIRSVSFVVHSRKPERNHFSCPASHEERHLGCGELGFSAMELLIIVLLISIVAAISVPSVTSITRNLRMVGDGRALASEINLARMRAAADFTHARVYMDLNANTFHMEEWNKSSACWKTDGDSGPCTQTTSPVNSLSQGDSFGFGSLTTGPTTATTSTAQPLACTVGVAGAAAGANLSNTACIEIDSRGYPVDSSDNIVATDAVYLTNNQNLYTAIAVTVSGKPTIYSYTGSGWVAF